MGRIIGIDLGTTTSEMAYIKNGKPEIIVNKEGGRITESVVNFKDGNFIVGKNAKKNSIVDPQNSAVEIKRLMGSKTMVNIGGRDFLPEEISAMILRNLKLAAEEYLGEVVTEAVITVPANFNDIERNATKKAGELAGFKVDRIINEPTAAALAYGIGNMESEAKILVYDLGGGTFDVTVLEFFSGILDVKASRGNNKLGGKDFDEKIVEHIVTKIKNEFSVDIRNNKKAMSRIKDAAEEAKKDLSTMNSTEVSLMYLAMDSSGEPINLDFKLTRAEFEKLIFELVDETKNTVSEALEAAKYSSKDIDIVLAIGGSTRVPLVRNTIKEIFGDKIKSEISADEAVALGAAVQAGINNEDISSEEGIIITDTCNFTLGTNIIKKLPSGEVLDNVFSPIIKRDTKIPCVESKVYLTASDDQTSVDITVYQGENEEANRNTLIGNFVLDGIPPAEAGKEKIEIQFTYNLNGILEVRGMVLSNGKSVNGVIDTSKIEGYTENRVENDINNLESYPLYPLIKETLELVEKRKGKINSKFMTKLETLVKEVKLAVKNNDENLVRKLDEDITDILFDL